MSVLRVINLQSMELIIEEIYKRKIRGNKTNLER